MNSKSLIYTCNVSISYKIVYNIALPFLIFVFLHLNFIFKNLAWLTGLYARRASQEYKNVNSTLLTFQLYFTWNQYSTWAYRLSYIKKKKNPIHNETNNRIVRVRAVNQYFSFYFIHIQHIFHVIYCILSTMCKSFYVLISMVLCIFWFNIRRYMFELLNVTRCMLIVRYGKISYRYESEHFLIKKIWQ